MPMETYTTAAACAEERMRLAVELESLDRGTTDGSDLGERELLDAEGDGE